MMICKLTRSYIEPQNSDFLPKGTLVQVLGYSKHDEEKHVSTAMMECRLLGFSVCTTFEHGLVGRHLEEYDGEIYTGLYLSVPADALEVADTDAVRFRRLGFASQRSALGWMEVGNRVEGL
jgi:hypothetical protein